MEVSVQFSFPLYFTFAETARGIRCVRDRVCFRVGLDAMEKRKISLLKHLSCVHCIHTNQLSPCSWVLLEKEIAVHLLKKFQALCGTIMFINMLTKALPTPYPEPKESNPHPPSYFFNIQYDTFLVVPFLTVFLPKLCMHLISFPFMLHALPISYFLSWSF
jgi:hypothetical protein